MFGTALQFSGVSGEDRFYIPVKARKNHNQRKQAQKARKGETEIADSTSKSKVVVSESRNSYEPSYSSTKPPSSPSVEPASNIDMFLESTRPLVPAQYFSKVDLIRPFSFSSTYIL